MPAWIVDGMNVIGSRGARDGPWWRDRQGAQRGLAERLSRWAQDRDEPVAVVFDGAQHEIDAPGIEVAFASRRGRDAADDDIAARVAGAADPAALRVVTADADLARRVREHMAEVVGPGALLRELPD